jgi:hypothetical protein
MAREWHDRTLMAVSAALASAFARIRDKVKGCRAPRKAPA